MQTTDNYGLKVYEGADLFNPLTVENVNTESLDLIIKAISDQAIGTATELTTGTVHALTRSDSDQALFRFTATSNFVVGDTFTVDTIQVSALTINGQALPGGAYLAGAEVLCALVGTRLTVYGVTGSVIADDSLMLGGQLPSYYGKATDVTLAQNTATAAGTLATQLDGRVTALEQAGSGLKPTVLWTNATPTSAFGAETIQLLDDLTNYDFYEILCRISTNVASVVSSGLIPTDSSVLVNALYWTGRQREFTPSGGNIATGTGQAYNTYGSGPSSDGSVMIPLKIIGFKK